jgi:chaperonin cofactor prefoldin
MPVPPARAPGEAELIAGIRREIDDLRGQLQQLQSDVHDLATRQHEIDAEVRGLKDALGG